MLVSPVFPFVAIQTGWITAEVGRQPWVVYPSTSGPDGVSLLTNDAISQSVSAPELLVTLALFFVVYVFLMVAWARVMGRFIKEGPVAKPAVAVAGAAADAASASAGSAALAGGEDAPEPQADANAKADAKDGE